MSDKKLFPFAEEEFPDVDGYYRREAEFFRACFNHCRIPSHLGLERFHPQLFEKAIH